MKTPILPPFRIEVRPKNSEAADPWGIFSLASTEHQAAEKIADYSSHYPDFEFRSVENDADDGAELAAIVANLETAAEFHAAIVDACGTDDPAELGRLVKESRLAPERIQRAADRTAAAEKELAFMRDPGTAVPAEFEYPFEVGDKLRDVHSGIVVTVRAIASASTGGDGFDFDMPGGEPGYCPRESIEYYEPIGRAKKKKTDKTQAPFQAPAGDSES